jgi:hypothetical protein
VAGSRGQGPVSHGDVSLADVSSTFVRDRRANQRFEQHFVLPARVNVSGPDVAWADGASEAEPAHAAPSGRLGHHGGMGHDNAPPPPAPPGVSWARLEVEAPELARFVGELFGARRHHLMATLRADGAPRISGTEITIHAGELWIGGLPGSRKLDDLRRDPRLAVHTGSADPPEWRGDARVTGRAIFVDDEATKSAFLAAAGGGPPGPFDLVRIAITEVSTVREAPSRDHLLIGL